jgi:hypothetical protein
MQFLSQYLPFGQFLGMASAMTAILAHVSFSMHSLPATGLIFQNLQIPDHAVIRPRLDRGVIAQCGAHCNQISLQPHFTRFPLRQ